MMDRWGSCSRLFSPWQVTTGKCGCPTLTSSWVLRGASGVTYDSGNHGYSPHKVGICKVEVHARGQGQHMLQSCAQEGNQQRPPKQCPKNDGDLFGGFHSHGITTVAGWFTSGKNIRKGMIYGYHYFRKPPLGFFELYYHCWLRTVHNTNQSRNNRLIDHIHHGSWKLLQFVDVVRKGTCWF